MFEDDVTVPAGWYPDPMGLPQLRWWNNHAWTELTTEARPPLVAQQPTQLLYADDELPTRRQQREQREREAEYARLATGDETESADARGPVTPDEPVAVTIRQIESSTPRSSEPVIEYGDHYDDVDDTFVDDTFVDDTIVDDTIAPTRSERLDDRPFDDRFVDDVDRTTDAYTSRFSPDFVPRSATSAASRRTDTAEPELPRTAAEPRLTVYTAPVWIIALLPLAQLVVGLLVLVGFGAFPNVYVSAGAFVLPYLLVVAMAIVDRALLRRAGHEHPAHWAWAFLSAPVYLIARAIGLGRSGSFGVAPLLVWGALGMLQVASVLVIPGMLISVIPSVFSAQAEQSVAADASVVGATLQVHCPTPPALLIGQTFTCTASSTAGHDLRVTVSLQRANGWIDWKVDDWGNTFVN